MVNEQQQDDVFVLTVEFTPIFTADDIFNLGEVPQEEVVVAPEDEPVEDEVLEDVLDGVPDPLAEGDFWCGPMTYFQILADPGYQEWLRQTEALNYYIQTGDFSVFEPWQQVEDA